MPASLVLMVTLSGFRLITDDPQTLNHNAVIVGFFIVYFILVRGGHILMVRSMHRELLLNYEDAYKARLAKLPRRSKGLFERRGNIGFTLAKIKRGLITQFGAR